MEYMDKVQLVADLKNASNNQLLSNEWREVFSKAALVISGYMATPTNTDGE